MKDKPVILVVGVQYKGPPEREEEFSRWYSESHVPHCLNTTKRIKGATRYKLIGVTRPGREQPKYLAIYYFKNRKDYEDWSKGPEYQGCIAQRRGFWSDDAFYSMNNGAYEVIDEWPE